MKRSTLCSYVVCLLAAADEREHQMEAGTYGNVRWEPISHSQGCVAVSWQDVRAGVEFGNLSRFWHIQIAAGGYAQCSCTVSPQSSIIRMLSAGEYRMARKRGSMFFSPFGSVLHGER